MGKQGPCYHCGVTSTPLWRNGPPEKPVLCNACGSRWRTKGTLVNYTPLHARTEPGDYQDHKFLRLKSIPIKKNKEPKMLKRKQNRDNVFPPGALPDYNQGFRKVVDEDKGNRSSSGSAISNSESCAQYGSADASELTGPAQSIVWDAPVPSRKRTCVSRSKPSPIEKLTKDLYTILHEQRSCYFSGSSQDDLLFESGTQMMSEKIGHGGVLMRHPRTIAREDESEASSLSVDNRQCPTTEAYSYGTIPAHNDSDCVNFSSQGIEKIRNSVDQGMQHEQVKSGKYPYANAELLENKSLLYHIDLEDIVNHEEFMRHFTNKEQQQLLKCLPVVDTVELPDSLKSMFNSPQFKANLTHFQQLLEDGVLDISFPDAKSKDFETLKNLALYNSSKSKLVEQYNLLKRCKTSYLKSAVGCTATMHHMHEPNDTIHEEKTTTKNTKKVFMKAICEDKESLEGSCFGPRSLFALPPDGSSLLLDSFHFTEECSDLDLLLEVPPNGSFAQAELLDPTLSYDTQASTSGSSLYPRLLHP